MEIETTPELVSKVYKKIEENISKYRKLVNRPLTLTEKILVGHLDDIKSAKDLEPGKSYSFLRPDRVALQDVTGQMVILRSEERRVGKECRYRRSRYQQENKIGRSGDHRHHADTQPHH